MYIEEFKNVIVIKLKFFRIFMLQAINAMLDFKKGKEKIDFVNILFILQSNRKL